MAVYCPPSYTETLTTFNNIYYVDNCPSITTAYLNANFLKYPTAQGDENFLNTSTGENCIISPTGLSNINNYDISITPTSNINLEANNINSYGFALPICFTRERTDGFNYTSGGQTVEIVYTTDFNIPSKFCSDSPPSGYTSNRWKIDFALNCYNCSNLGDKGLALFIVFQDQASTYYLPFNYNPDTPYAKWQNPSTYTSPSYGGFQNFNWTDLIDLSGLSGTGSGNVPLIMTLAFAGDSGFSCNFHMTCTLTRTNLI